MDISKLIEFMGTYPHWVRLLLGIWAVLSAALFFVLIYFYQSPISKLSTPVGTAVAAAEPRWLQGEQVRSHDPRYAIVDRSTHAPLDDTIALALDRTKTELQRETILERLNGWAVEASGTLQNVRRMPLRENLQFLVCLDIGQTVLGASTSLLFVEFPTTAEQWLHALRTGDRLHLSGILEVTSSTVTITVPRPLRHYREEAA